MLALSRPWQIYFAWRLLQATPAAPTTVCVYERSQRLGGRILSLRDQGPRGDLTADMGAYRFVDTPTKERHSTWGYIYTPLTAALIETKLGLPVAPYEPGDPTSHMKKIVDATGENAGYATFVEAMLKQVEADDRFTVHLGQELVAIEPADGSRPLTMRFASGITATAGTLVLNLPQLPLLRVLSASESLLSAAGGMPVALQAPRPTDGAKLYIHYSNAWWRNLLGRSSGEFATGSGTMVNATANTQLPELFGRYHDGHTRCDGATPHTRCRGFLEATYTYAENARWFLNHEPSVDPPYTSLLPSTLAGQFALDLFHQTLVRYHSTALERVSTPTFNATAYVLAMRPEMALLSYWGVQTLGYGGAVHGTRPGPMIEVSEVGPMAMAPFGKQRVYVANEAFGALRGLDGVLGGHHGWAECSLVQAENLLISGAFGLQPPDWVNRSVYEEYVRYHSEPTEIGRRGGWRQG